MRQRGPSGRWMLGIAVAAAVLLVGCSREAADWKQASTANSIEAYQLYLQQHPHGTQAAAAQGHLQQLIEQRDWQIATAGNSRDAYQQFLTQHPNGQWSQEARLRIENFAQAAESAGAAGAAATPGANPQVTTAPAASATARADTAPLPSTPAVSKPTRAAHAEHPGHANLLARREHHEHHFANATTSASGRTVQLGAYRTRARAETEWRHLSARFVTLRSLHPRYVAVRSRNGRMYRLQVHLSSAAAASGLCESLKRHALACVRVNA